MAAAPENVVPPVAAATSAWLTPVELLVLGAIWGASFLFMRIAAKDFGAFALVEVRLALGGLILSPFLWRERRRITGTLWWKIVGIGAINSAIPFVLFAWAAQRAPAGIGAISNATAAMFTALIALLFFGERIDTRRAMGLVAGFVGVVVLASDKTGGESVWQAALVGTFAAFLYGIGANLLRKHLSGIPAGANASATLLCASVLLSPLAIATWPDHPIPTVSWVCAITLGVLCTGVAYTLFYRLIYRIGAPRASTVTYLVPLFGVLWAWLLLDEPVTFSMTVACALILGSVALSQQRSSGAK
ncbi:MAG TPA: DMT family transporter [Povalibacter sp.]|uniref:DMT family transporter n=1 Tax=Povalibacter sp. TaxID=1962978 RepID=UPI002CA07277|nr:DMT family transporter [Povalibacter sp.]HMN44212.1 DMT family transporter [Povalibacter sp.]